MLEQMVLLAGMALQESRESAVTPDPLEHPEPQDPPEPPAPSDPWASRETEEMVVPKDPQDLPDQLELEAWLDPKDRVETRERPARQARGDRRVTVASLDCRVFPDPLVPLETPVLLDLPDLPELRDPLDHLDPQAKTDLTERPDPSDLPDPAVALESPDLLVLPETLDPQDPPDLPAPASTCLPSPACRSPRRARTPCAT